MPHFRRSLLATAILTATLGLSACGGSSGSSTPTTPTTPAPTNNAPTDITLTSTSVMENMAGAAVGTLGATDADSGDSFTFAVDDDRFEIDGDLLKLTDGTEFDYETTQSVDVTLTVTDSGSATFSKTVQISIDDQLDFYAFDSAIMPGEESVSFTGQTARHLLINDLNILINTQLANTTDFDTAGTFVTRDDVLNALNSYFDVTDYDALSQRPLLTTTTPESSRLTLAEVSSSSKTLVGKIAGNDAVGQHKDWNNGEFAGWGETGDTTPEGLVRTFFDMLADNAAEQLAGNQRFDPFGDEITTLYLTHDGRDLKQLIQKFLLMSVAFSQAADDYLDNDTDGKGLLSDHTNTDAAYTNLEHQFDEGFGYFGAARDYLNYSDEEIAGKGGRDDWQVYHDTDGSGTIDFHTEFNFGQSTNAAKRDLGATTAVDLTAEAMNGFLAGRKLLNDTAGTPLTDAQMTELEGYRDTALLAWEKSIVATVIHYINDTWNDLSTIDTDEFNYADLAKHWSEMKGFALGLQFNPFSPVSDSDFEQLHQLIGDKPVLGGDVGGYQADLISARDLLRDAYGFDQQDVENW